MERRKPAPQEVKHREEFKLTPIVYILLRQDNAVLLLRRISTGRYSLPAGHLDAGEKLPQAAIREAHEEVGVKIKPEDLEYVHLGHYKDNDGQRAAFFFQTTTWEGKPRAMEPEQHNEARWFSNDNLPEKMSPHTKMAIQNILIGKPVTEFGW